MHGHRSGAFQSNNLAAGGYRGRPSATIGTESVATDTLTFRNQVYQQVALIPYGRVTTYGAIASALGYPRRAREVGWALFSTPSGSGLPTHRVVNARGALSGGWAFGGDEVQRALLAAEGVRFLEDGRVDLNTHLGRGGSE